MTSMDFHRIRNFHDRALTEADRACVHELGLDERKRMVDDLHVPFDGFDQAFEFLAKRHRPIAGAAHDRGKFHLLVGSFRSGKSWPVIHFAQRENAARGDRDHHPVVHVTCADGWGAKQVLAAIVQQLNGARPTDRYGVAAITESVINLLERFKVELVVVDELHEVMNRNKQGSLLMTNLRQVVDARHCNVVGVGEQSLHKTIKESCAYMAGRGGLLSHTVVSPDWHAKEGKEDYRLFLDMVDDRLPFRRKSGLGIPRYAAHFYDMSKGSVGFTMSYVAAAAYLALDEGADRIGQAHLVKVAVEARGTAGTFTHFVDALPDNLVARREKAA